MHNPRRVIALVLSCAVLPVSAPAQDDDVVSAREHFAEVLAAAVTYASDVELIFIDGGDVDESGESHNWTYFFKSPGLDRVLSWQYEHDDGSVRRLTGVRPSFPIALHPDMPAVPDDWIDSGIAIDSADASGGDTIRAANPPDTYHVELFLLPPSDQGRNLLFSEAAWLAVYSGDFGAHQIPILASTGAFLDYSSLTARSTFEDIERIALAKADDVEFIFIRAFEVNPDGTAPRWTYVFRSMNSRMLYSYIADGGRYAESNEPPPGEASLDSGPLPSEWLDSDTALDEAERRGGETFRASYGDWNINVILAVSESGLPEWNVFYNASANSVSYNIDAVPAQMSMIRSAIPPVTERARSEEADAELVYLGGPRVDLDGQGNEWFYFFKSMAGSRLFGLSVRNGHVLNEVMPMEPDVTFNLELPSVPDEFLDTDAAVAIAERMGGADFRAAHPDANIDVALLWLEREYTGEIGVGPRPIYLMTYVSADADTVYAFDAQAGHYDDWNETSARENLAALSEALNSEGLPSDIELMRIVTPEVNPTGTSKYWRYFYQSVSADRRNRVWVLGDHIYVPGGGLAGTWPDRRPLPESWIDSPLAISVIEEMGGRAFREANPVTEVFLELSANADGVYWDAMYGTDSQMESFRIDATDFTVSSEKLYEQVDVSGIAVYPHPFSAFASFRFGLSEPNEVSLVIFDILGRKLLTVAGEWRPAGAHTITVSTAGLAPGLYAYRLTHGSDSWSGQILKSR
jgi:hypothetical protein